MDKQTAKIKSLKKIVVATDLSPTADVAIMRAVDIAKMTHAKLTLLYVLHQSFLDNLLEKVVPSDFSRKLKKQYPLILEEKIRRLSAYPIAMDYAIVGKGRPAVKILQYAKRNKVDLLIMGSHGKYSIRDTFVGTTAEYVAQKTQIPLLIVKNNKRISYKNILIPVDFSRASKHALKYATQLFPSASIRLIHVGDYEFEDLLKREVRMGNISKKKFKQMRDAMLIYLEHTMQKFIKAAKTRHHQFADTIVLGYPSPTILHEVKRHATDLIIMGTQGHGRLHYLFMGSVASGVLRETENDLLLIPPRSTK